MKRVFIDTSGFFAALTDFDEHHAQCKPLFEKAKQHSWRFITSNAVVYETYALLLHRTRMGRQNGLNFLEMLETQPYQIERVKKSDEDKAIQILQRQQDKSYSLCDALSFVLMERLQISEAISFDRHFAGYGRFTVL